MLKKLFAILSVLMLIFQQVAFADTLETKQILNAVYDSATQTLKTGGSPSFTDLTVSGDTTLNGGLLENVTTVNASTYQTTGSEIILNVTYTTTGSVTVTLDTDEDDSGRIIKIKDAGGNAGTNNITVATEGSETIDGASTYTINANYDSITLYSDSSNWYII